MARLPYCRMIARFAPVLTLQKCRRRYDTPKLGTRRSHDATHSIDRKVIDLPLALSGLIKAADRGMEVQARFAITVIGVWVTFGRGGPPTATDQPVTGEFGQCSMGAEAVAAAARSSWGPWGPGTEAGGLEHDRLRGDGQ
ncbi:hypothetical protein MMC29_005248 [Sticta canariensis]|nr:hypothetical protein [Sticta canariensis]